MVCPHRSQRDSSYTLSTCKTPKNKDKINILKEKKKKKKKKKKRRRKKVNIKQSHKISFFDRQIRSA